MIFRGYNQDYKIHEVFEVESGKRITEREVYQNLGKIPVVTSKSLGEGITWYEDETWLKKKGKIFTGELLTWTKEGYAGKLFYRNQKFFPIDVCGVLIPKKEFKDKLNLKWFLYCQQNIFYQNVYSKGTQGKLYQDTVNNIEFTLIDKTKQDILEKKYNQLHNMKISSNKVLSEIYNLKNKYLLLNNDSLEEPISKILQHTSRNDELSEEGIYKRSEGIKTAGKDLIQVFSGSIKGIYGIVPIKKDLHFIKNKPCLQVITRGNAGRITFIPTGNYATNTNSMLLTIIEEKKRELNIKTIEDEEIYLKFLVVYLQSIFKENSSSADLSVFPLTEMIKKIRLPIFKLDNKVKKIVRQIDNLDRISNKLTNVLIDINNLFSSSVIIK